MRIDERTADRHGVHLVTSVGDSAAKLRDARSPCFVSGRESLLQQIAHGGKSDRVLTRSWADRSRPRRCQAADLPRCTSGIQVQARYVGWVSGLDLHEFLTNAISCIAAFRGMFNVFSNYLSGPPRRR